MQITNFKKLERLTEHTDEVFEKFYKELLSNKVFAKHFKGEGHIRSLLDKQKHNFIETLQESKAELIERYYRVGVVHYEHNIPYEVFLSGTRILRDAFNNTINSRMGDLDLILLNDAMFDFISDGMAKGYMDIYIRNEKADLEKILAMTKSASFGTERKLLIKHYNWMLDLLSAVEQKDYAAQHELVRNQSMDTETLYAYIEEHLDDVEPTIQREDIERIRFRIIANTENIFFYLRREAYSEVLSLIINILEIYKLSLVLDNVISNIVVKKAEHVISEKEKLSEIDPLTNIMNRRKFEELLESLLLRSQRTSLPLTIMVMDIDDFKEINDKYGHQCGDEVLVEIAHMISGSIRKNDHLVRYGGEEFVIISADSELEGMIHLAEKIRKDIEKHRFTCVGRVTMSLGLAELNEDDDSSSLFKRADEKLYSAKASGKNCVHY